MAIRKGAWSGTLQPLLDCMAAHIGLGKSLLSFRRPLGREEEKKGKQYGFWWKEVLGNSQKSCVIQMSVFKDNTIGYCEVCEEASKRLQRGFAYWEFGFLLRKAGWLLMKRSIGKFIEVLCNTEFCMEGQYSWILWSLQRGFFGGSLSEAGILAVWFLQVCWIMQLSEKKRRKFWSKANA